VLCRTNSTLLTVEGVAQSTVSWSISYRLFSARDRHHAAYMCHGCSVCICFTVKKRTYNDSSCDVSDCV